MADSPAHSLGIGSLTPQRVVGHALGMVRQSFGRIALAAAIFFALPALVAVSAEHAVLSLTPEHGNLSVVIAYAAVMLAVALRVLGPVAFAGFLDEAVAQEFFNGERRHLRDVMSALPWRRLIAADLILVALVAVGLQLFVIPGLVAFGGLGLVGPVVVQEKDDVMSSFRRTLALAATAPVLVTLLVVTPFAVEQVVHEAILHSLESSGIGVQVLAEWLIALVLGGTLGLLEVALASELIARHPRRLLDDGQAPAV